VTKALPLCALPGDQGDAVLDGNSLADRSIDGLARRAALTRA